MAIIASFISLRYELAIVLPKEKYRASNILFLSLVILIINTLLVGAIIYFFRNAFVELFNITYFNNYIFFLIFIGIVFMGLYQIFNYWAIRYDNFSTISLSKIYGSIGQLVIQIFLGCMNFSVFGLIIGGIMKFIIGVILLFKNFLKTSNKALRDFHFKNIFIEAKQYKKFPIFSSPSVLINRAGLYLPQVAIFTLYGPFIAGLFALTQRILGKPITILGRSLGQTYFGKASKEFKNNPEKLYRFFIRLSIILFIIGAFLLIAIELIASTKLLVLFFGDKWNDINLYIQRLAPLFVIKLIVTPFSQTLNIINRQDLQLFWDLFRLIIVVGVFIIIKLKNLAPLSGVSLYSGSVFFVYFIFYMTIKKELLKFLNDV